MYIISDAEVSKDSCFPLRDTKSLRLSRELCISCHIIPIHPPRKGGMAPGSSD
jgi:hypothetical protein